MTTTIPEPQTVYPEAEFQKAIVALIKGVLTESNRKFALLERFGLDVAVFFEVPQATTIRLLEVKSFGGQRMGGVGFGNGKGVGPQVDLTISELESLCLFDDAVRWAFANATQAAGTRRYALFTCSTAKNAAMGTVLRGKQNNLRVSALRPCMVDWRGFCSQVREFLLANPVGQEGRDLQVRSR
jgi:hypothetical protein